MEREWIFDYDEDLVEISAQLPHYEGDVRKGKEDLKKQRDAFQKKLEKAKKEDPDLEPFKERLEDIDWGEKELEKIEPIEEGEALRLVIKRLQARLEELNHEPDGEDTKDE